MRLAKIVASSVSAAALEALVIILIVATSLSVADSSTSIELTLPWGAEIRLSRTYALAMAGVATLGCLVAHLQTARQTAALGAEVVGNIRRETIRAFSTAAWERQSDEQEGALHITATEHASSAAQYSLAVGALMSSISALAAMMAASLLVNAPATGGLILGGILLFFLMRPLGRRTRRLAERSVDSTTHLLKSFSQWSRLTSQLRVYGVEDVRRDALLKLNGASAEAFYQSRLSSRSAPSLFRDIALLFVVLLIGILSRIDSVDLASVGAVMLLVIRALGYAQQVQSVSHGMAENAPNIDAATRHIADLQAQRFVVGDTHIAAFGPLALRDVAYRYPDGRVGVSDVTLRIEPGRTYGVVGPSGGGKSTLMQLIARLRLPTDGRISVSGTDYEMFEPVDWSKHVSMVPQDAILFAGTVRENISFFRDLDEQAVIEAARQACVLDEILNLPGGLDYELGPDGSGLSGGQRQRVAIARGLAGFPSLLIMDEPTSALDSVSEQAFTDVLVSVKGRLSVIIVAHRFSSLAACDSFFLVSDGTVTEVDNLSIAKSLMEAVDE